MDSRSVAVRNSPARHARAFATAALAVAVLASVLGGTAPPPAEATSTLPAAQRLFGPDRYQTAARVSQHVFPDGANVAYLVTGEGFVDGLAAGPAAAQDGGPVLLTPGASLAPATAAEIQRLDPSRIVIVGGTPTISAVVEAEVRALDPGREVVRVAGASRFDTNLLVAERAFPDASAVFLTNAFRFPDGLAGGPAAALVAGPMLIEDGSRDALRPELRDLLETLNVQWAGILGGEDAISVGIAEDVPDSAEVRRFARPDRFHTATTLIELFPVIDTVYIASGETFADALAGAAAAGAEGAPMLLARRDCMPFSTLTALQEIQPDEIILLGGEPTLGPATAAYTSC